MGVCFFLNPTLKKPRRLSEHPQLIADKSLPAQLAAGKKKNKLKKKKTKQNRKKEGEQRKEQGESPADTSDPVVWIGEINFPTGLAVLGKP